MRPEPRNEMSGTAKNVLQAGTVSGNVYIHSPQDGVDPLAAAVARPITEWDPFDLDVHRAITTSTSVQLPELPRYARRDHDDKLVGHLNEPSRSIMVVLTGGSSTGKTRALYEAVHNHEALREWPLLYARTADTLLRLVQHDRVTPGTVLWLNETQNHLSGPTGETVAAWLRALLDGSVKGPVIVLGTLWPQFWAELSNQPHARALLQHGVRRVRVAEQFTSEQLTQLRADRSTDPRLAIAATTSGSHGHVIQTLAGGPALVERYEHPDRAEDRYATAIVTAAIDAQRLGHPSLLPHALLADAAYGYLSDEDRTDPPEDWFTTGMSLAAKDPVHGITALQPRREQPGVGPPDGYELHDYLYQHGHTTRGPLPAPESLWEALVQHTTDQQAQLGVAEQAYQRLLYRYADPLCRLYLSGEPIQLDDHIFEVLITYGRTAEALALTLEHLADPAHKVDDDYLLLKTMRLVHKLVEQDQITELRQLAEAGDQYARRRLADLLADQGEWAQALELVRGGSVAWSGGWMARRLAESGQVDKLRQLVEMGGGIEAAEFLIEALLECGAEREALDVLDGQETRGFHRDPSKRLVAHMVKHNRIDEVIQSLRMEGSASTFQHLIDAMVANGRTEELSSLLRTMVDPENSTSLPVRDTANAALADQLARQGDWNAVFELLRSGEPWTRRWLPKKLRELGKLDDLRRLVDAIGFDARQQYIGALLDTGRSDEALALLRQFANGRTSGWYGEQLATVLRERGLINELLTRTATGNYFCAQQVVALAQRGQLPADLLTYGLTVDGSIATQAV